MYINCPHQHALYKAWRSFKCTQDPFHFKRVSSITVGFNSSVTQIAGCLVCSLPAILKELPKASICASDISQLSGADGQVLQQLAATDFSRSTRTLVGFFEAFAEELL